MSYFLSDDKTLDYESKLRSFKHYVRKFIVTDEEILLAVERIEKHPKYIEYIKHNKNYINVINTPLIDRLAIEFSTRKILEIDLMNDDYFIFYRIKENILHKLYETHRQIIKHELCGICHCFLHTTEVNDFPNKYRMCCRCYDNYRKFLEKNGLLEDGYCLFFGEEGSDKFDLNDYLKVY